MTEDDSPQIMLPSELCDHAGGPLKLDPVPCGVVRRLDYCGFTGVYDPRSGLATIVPTEQAAKMARLLNATPLQDDTEGLAFL